jgi:hypothetical protein
MAPRNGRSGRQPPRKRAASTSPTRSPKNQKRITSSKAEKSWQQHVPIKKVQSITSNAAALRGSWRKHPRPQSARSGVPDLPEELLVTVFSYVSIYAHRFETHLGTKLSPGYPQRAQPFKRGSLSYILNTFTTLALHPLASPNPPNSSRWLYFVLFFTPHQLAFTLRATSIFHSFSSSQLTANSAI